MKIQNLLVISVGALCGALLSILPSAKHIDYYLHDFLINPKSIQPPTQNVVVIGIDDASLARFSEPLVLWHKYLAKVIRASTENGASAVGLDIIPSVALDEVAPQMDIALMQSIRSAVNANVPIILGYKAGDGGIEPHRKFLFASSGKGYVNLTPDDDQKIRRQGLSLPGPDGKIYPSMISLLAQSIGVDISKAPVELLIDYRLLSPPVISFAEVYDWSEKGAVEKLNDAFKDKIVLIGITTKKLPDHHPVPVGQGRMDGVVIQGIGIETLLSGKYIRTLPVGYVWPMAIGAAILTGTVFLFLAPLFAMTAALALLGVIFLGVYLLFAHYWTLPISPFIACIAAPGLVSGLYRYSKEYGQFRTLQKYFKSYVSPHVLRQLIENPESVSFDGEVVTATVMFTDIRGFTTLSEQISPRELIQGLNKYFTGMTGAVTSMDGYLNKYLGDGILAIFGAPNKLPHDGALAAVKCGLLMLEKLEELNKTRIFPNVERLEIGIGIHTGEAVVGNAGCFEKMDYSILGDTVNLAARIESETKSHGVKMLISEETFRRVQGYVNVQFVANVKVKGREQEAALYRVLSLKEGT